MFSGWLRDHVILHYLFTVTQSNSLSNRSNDSIWSFYGKTIFHNFHNFGDIYLPDPQSSMVADIKIWGMQYVWESLIVLRRNTCLHTPAEKKIVSVIVVLWPWLWLSWLMYELRVYTNENIISSGISRNSVIYDLSEDGLSFRINAISHSSASSNNFRG